LRTRLQANCIGSLAAQALTEVKSGAIGEVVATFPNSFYVRTTSQQLIFVTSRQLKSPITVNLDSRTDLGQVVRPFEAISFLGNEIRIGEFASIDLDGARFGHDLVPLNHSLKVNRDLLNLGSLILVIIDNSLSVLDPVSFAHAGVLEFVANGVLPFRVSDDTMRFCDAAGKIVGLGGGFTPSGDDLLGGFLATFNSFAREIDRQVVTLDSGMVEGKTSWISMRLLDYMQRRILDDQVRRLIGSAASGDLDRFIPDLETLLPRGHTSGIDILVGVILALSIAYDIERRTNETSAIVQRLGLSC
jgi:hypothetical protein